MRAGSAVASGNLSPAGLAEQAVRAALERAGLKRAARVLLFLTRDCARQARAAVRAAAGAAGTLDVAGCSAWGVVGDDGPVFDGPAAAALVLDAAPTAGKGGPHLFFSGHGALPGGSTANAGLVDEDAAVWEHSRCAREASVEVALNGIAGRGVLAATVDREKPPVFALFFSCLGRGPLFYGGEDRDLAVFRETFPGIPVAGAYGSGQIAPGTGGNRLFRNSVVTLLCEPAHVQSLP